MSAHECHLVLPPEQRDEVTRRLQDFGEATVETWQHFLSAPSDQTGGTADEGGTGSGEVGGDGGGGSGEDGGGGGAGTPRTADKPLSKGAAAVRPLLDILVPKEVRVHAACACRMCCVCMPRCGDVHAVLR